MNFKFYTSPFQIPEKHIWIVYCLTASVFLGAHILSINTVVGEMSLYRLTMILTISYLILNNLFNRNYLYFSNKSHNLEIDFVFIFWLLWAYISIIWVEDASRWFTAVYFVTFGILSILVISNSIQRYNTFRILLTIVFFMIVLNQFVGLFEVFTGRYFFNDGAISGSFGLNNPLSIFRNINDFSTLMFTGVPVSLIVFTLDKRILYKTLASLSFLLSLLFILYTGSRGNQLALVLFFTTLFVLKFNDWKKYIFKAIIFLTIFIGVAFVVYLLLFDLRINFYNVVIKFFEYEGSNTYRVNMLLNGLSFLTSTFGFGVGAGNIEHWMINYPIFNVDAPNIHNWFFEILVGYGIIVFILYLFLYIYILWILFKSIKFTKSKNEYFISLYLFCFVIGFIVASISSASNIIIEWQWVFWGIIIGYVKLNNYKMLSNYNLINDSKVSKGR